MSHSPAEGLGFGCSQSLCPGEAPRQGWGGLAGPDGTPAHSGADFSEVVFELQQANKWFEAQPVLFQRTWLVF